MATIGRLRNPIRSYDWGSHTALARLTGRPEPTSEPEAELWMGAHPSAPSRIETDRGWVALHQWIASDPVGVLGVSVAERFDGELPFLFKVLAPARALSVQAHPDADQAREGFARENASGLALDDPKRCYRDPNPKPELICALTEFHALCGFRTVAEIAERIADLRVSELDRLAEPLIAAPGRDGLQAVFEALFAWPADRRTQVVRQAASAAERSDDEALARWIPELERQRPGDVGVLAPLFLNVVELTPGQALFLGAGELHAYLEGVGVELMGNSDNVLRGGLTAKHVDVPELLRTLTFRSGPPEILEAVGADPGRATFATSAPEFELSILRLRPGADLAIGSDHGVEILLVTSGEVRLAADAGADLAVRTGESVFVSAGAGGYRLTAGGGDARVHRAGVPR